MLLNLWNYFKGYVIIEVSGFSVERFVNLAVHRGIYVWDVKYSGSKVYMKVSAEGFKKLKECGRKTKCKYKIISKKGCPFLTFKYRKRKIFGAGLIIFVLCLYLLSSFVWMIEIKGNDRIQDEEILRYLDEQGLKVGVLKRNIDKKAIEQDMVIQFKDISFLNIGIDGTKATITLSEIIPKQELVNRDTPCHIIAKKDGLISSIVASNGTPLVKAKDVVEKGEVLISGELEMLDDNTGTNIVSGYTHAGGSVKAKIFYEMNFKVPNKYFKKEYTGETKKYYRFNLFNQDINILNPSIPYENYDKITSRSQIGIGDNYPLPIIVIKDEYRSFKNVEVKRNLEQMLEVSQIMVNNRIIREFEFETDVVDKRIEYTETPDGLEIQAVVTTIEEIGEAHPIENMIDFDGMESETAEPSP